jgi:cell division protein FtsI/penicillin-binding protein 2
MQREHARIKMFSRRAALLGGGQFLLLSALVGRMYYLQVVEAGRYAMLADENRISLRLLPPPRGRIVDRFGVSLARNRLNYRVVIVPSGVQASTRRCRLWIPFFPSRNVNAAISSARSAASAASCR